MACLASAFFNMAIIPQKKYDHGDVIVRFSDASFGYSEKLPILNEANFSVRERAKITLMGQNGAGKSTIFKLITKEIKPPETKPVETILTKPQQIEKPKN